MNTEKNKTVLTAYRTRKTVAPNLIISGIIVILISIVWSYFVYENGASDRGKYFWWEYDCKPFNFFFGELFQQLYGYVFLGGIIDLLSGIFLSLMFKDSSLTITDKDIRGHTSFGRAVSILITQVSSVELAAFNGIKISTASGPVYFWNIHNRTEVFDTISDLLKDL